jgi:hypothetical protein
MVDDITSDNIIDLQEANGDITITGRVDGTAKIGDTVTLTIDGQDYLATVQTDYTFSITVPASILTADSDHVIQASVTTLNGNGNPDTTTIDKSYFVDTIPPTVDDGRDRTPPQVTEDKQPILYNELVTLNHDYRLVWLDHSINRDRMTPIRDGEYAQEFPEVRPDQVPDGEYAITREGTMFDNVPDGEYGVSHSNLDHSAVLYDNDDKLLPDADYSTYEAMDHVFMKNDIFKSDVDIALGKCLVGEA